jgi:quercetin dioxygenase-like cupin family protein
LKAGEVLWRDAEKHSSEVLTDIRVLLFELKGSKRARAAAPAGGVPDAVAADPAHFKTLLDNERVRVLEFRAAPGDESPMHSHPYHVTYAFTATKTKFTDPKGKSEERSRGAGTLAITLPGSHSTKVTGDTAAHVLLVELK